MINIPNCPKCGSNTAPDLIEIKILEDDCFDTYEEFYECECGCKFVALIERPIDEQCLVHRLEHEEKRGKINEN